MFSLEKQTCIKVAIFDQNHGLTPFAIRELRISNFVRTLVRNSVHFLMTFHMDN